LFIYVLRLRREMKRSWLLKLQNAEFKQQLSNAKGKPEKGELTDRKSRQWDPVFVQIPWSILKSLDRLETYFNTRCQTH